MVLGLVVWDVYLHTYMYMYVYLWREGGGRRVYILTKRNAEMR
jgi:hypothetical protein